MNKKIPRNPNLTSAAVPEIKMTVDSGRIIYRDKIDTLIGIKHPGIVLGVDIWGNTWVIHNHYKIGYPEIVLFNDFAAGVDVFYDERQVFYDPQAIVSNAIESWRNKEPYHWLYNNCQHFVNKATRGSKCSEAIDRVSNVVMVIGGILAFIGFIFRIKPLRNFGLILGAGGAIGKGLSRI